jgi:glyoxylase-like metal-dependent hydrolase (beta-lactamase superfamily II)
MKEHKIFGANYLIIYLTLASITTSFSQSRFSYDVEKVVPDVYLLKPTISDYRWVTSNIAVIVNNEDVFVVDSGLLPSAGEEAIKEIKKITNLPVRYLFNTHWHGDHWQGNAAFAKEYPGVEIITTAENLKMISRNGMVWATKLYDRYLDYYVNKYTEGVQSKTLDDKALSDSEIVELQKGLDQVKLDLGEMKSLEPLFPSTTYSDKMTIKSGDREIQLYYLGIGNTPGDGVVYLPKEKVLISGDLVVYPSPYESGMFSPEWLETSKKLAEFDYSFLLPGHGAVLKEHKYLNYLNSLYAEIIKEVSDAYASGITRADDIKKTVTNESIIAHLNEEPSYQAFTKDLDPGFVSSALDTSLRRIIQGKQ